MVTPGPISFIYSMTCRDFIVTKQTGFQASILILDGLAVIVFTSIIEPPIGGA